MVHRPRTFVVTPPESQPRGNSSGRAGWLRRRKLLRGAPSRMVSGLSQSARSESDAVHGGVEVTVARALYRLACLMRSGPLIGSPPAVGIASAVLRPSGRCAAPSPPQERIAAP